MRVLRFDVPGEAAAFWGENVPPGAVNAVAPVLDRKNALAFFNFLLDVLDISRRVPEDLVLVGIARVRLHPNREDAGVRHRGLEHDLWTAHSMSMVVHQVFRTESPSFVAGLWERKNCFQVDPCMWDLGIRTTIPPTTSS